MILLGRMQTLRVVKKTDFGVYLGDQGIESDFSFIPDKKEIVDVPSILLPKAQAKDLTTGDTVEVFIYKDSEDRPIATTAKPLLTMGAIARLTVKEVTNIGAFLDWGLAKDLFLPFKEQTFRVQRGDSVLVTLYIDKSSRLCATAKVYNSLQSNSPYQREDQVSGTVYEIIDAFGAYVAVDDRYSALIPNKELFTTLKPGEKVSARVTKVQPDGRLVLSIREKSYLQMDTDCSLIYDALIKAGGFLPYHDKTSPDLIKAKFGLSKNAFKRAIGHLQKEGKLLIEEDGISKTE
ncbi:MAG: S1 RNA-binding domain-containing protein [Lachnospiraceae bacterium]|nr:S1 RNA-binding domain-containing protein [Lachnospiraceae bacterium]MBP3578870.1 S1 RNA-binding domain-containing protein [Lachnospiraceae bacterium]